MGIVNKFLNTYGLANGIATLDGGGKVPLSQLPASLLEYKGNWSAATNTPTLADGTGVAGYTYVNTAAGTVNFGAGPITFAVGDWVIYDGSVWTKSINSNAVASVNGFTGVVVLTTTDVAEGSNLYYTDGRAQAAITGGASSIVTSNLTASRALVSDGSGKVAVSSVTATTLAFMDATSSVQTQLNSKQASGNYITALTGDATASGPGSAALTLATVNSNVGTFGSNSSTLLLTANGKGLITAVSSTAIQIGNTQVTNLVSDLAGKVSTTLSIGKIYVGNSSNVATAVSVSGDISLSDTGVSAYVGTVPLNKGGTGQTTKAPAFDALQPMTTGGDLIYGGASGTGTRLANGSSGALLTSGGGTAAPSWTSVLTNPMTTGGDIIYSLAAGVPARLANGTTGRVLTSAGGTSAPTWSAPAVNDYYGGYFSGATWTTTSATFADPTNSGTNTLTQRQASGMTVTAAASNLPGVTFTPASSTAIYRIQVSFQAFNATGGNNLGVRLFDGTTEITTMSAQSPGANGTNTMMLQGIYAPGTGSAVTVKIQSAASAGTTSFGFSAVGARAAEWTITRIK